MVYFACLWLRNQRSSSYRSVHWATAKVCVIVQSRPALGTALQSPLGIVWRMLWGSSVLEPRRLRWWHCGPISHLSLMLTALGQQNQRQILGETPPLVPRWQEAQWKEQLNSALRAEQQ